MLDWGVVTTLLGAAGVSTATRGGVAYTHLGDAVFHAREFVRIVERREAIADRSPDFASRLDAEAKVLADKIHDDLAKAINGLQDAIELGDPEQLQPLPRDARRGRS